MIPHLDLKMGGHDIVPCHKPVTPAPWSILKSKDQGLKRLMGFGNVPTETVIDATIGRQTHRGADFADDHQRQQADVGVGNYVDVALS